MSIAVAEQRVAAQVERVWCSLDQKTKYATQKSAVYLEKVRTHAINFLKKK